MTDIRPIQQPPREDLANALMIAQAWGDANVGYMADRTGVLETFRDVARLIRTALEKLAEPNAGAIRNPRKGSDYQALARWADRWLALYRQALEAK